MSPDRPSTTDLGQRAEAEGERYLVEQGYRIVERNFRVRGGEIDRIAWDGPVLVFVEIRTRGRDQWGGPEETVGPRKQRRLVLAARHYLARRHPDPPHCRFDVLTRLGESGAGSWELFQGAFEES